VLLSIPIWSMAGVEITGSTNEPPPFLVESKPDGKTEITNSGSETLVYVGLLSNGALIDGGPLEPGNHVDLSALSTPGKKLADLPSEMQQDVWSPEHQKEDLGRIARVFAFATDPPRSANNYDPYSLPKEKRRLGTLERPKLDQGKVPMVFVMTRTETLPIAVSGERVAGKGLVIWRREVTSGGAVSGKHHVMKQDEETP
jgi:hypothetical protein